MGRKKVLFENFSKAGYVLAEALSTRVLMRPTLYEYEVKLK